MRTRVMQHAGGRWMAPSFALLVLTLIVPSLAREKTETFDHDPNWHGHNNRPTLQPVSVRQDFGFSGDTSYAGGSPGEVGGFITQASEPAYYAVAIEPKTFKDKLTASGTFSVRTGGTPEDTGAHLLLGFFNSDTINEWRTPNTIALRISARGETFVPYLEYYTSQWRIGTLDGSKDFTNGKAGNRQFMTGDKVYRWTLEFDPQANDGKGVMTATIGDAKAVLYTNPDYLADGATFNRFGILNLMKAASEKEGGSEFYVDDVTINGRTESFDADPKWDGKDNRRTYGTQKVRPRFDFGYSETNFAQGKAKGELGGTTFRGDCRFPDRMAYYGDRIGPLTLDKPFKVSGKVALKRGVTDSTAMIGFFNSAATIEVSDRQDSGAPKSYVGICVEGPSSEGFYFYPGYRAVEAQGGAGRDQAPLRIRPDGQPHDWSLVYDPDGAGGNGTITVTLDGRSVVAELGEGHKAEKVTFDRFGILTPWIDGNDEDIYFDDLTYTVAQSAEAP